MAAGCTSRLCPTPPERSLPQRLRHADLDHGHIRAVVQSQTHRISTNGQSAARSSALLEDSSELTDGLNSLLFQELKLNARVEVVRWHPKGHPPTCGSTRTQKQTGLEAKQTGTAMAAFDLACANTWDRRFSCNVSIGCSSVPHLRSRCYKAPSTQDILLVECTIGVPPYSQWLRA